MFEVAFSRRMCCSRVCSVSTNPRRPSTSTVSPAMRPGIRRRYSSRAAKKPNDGPPKSRRLPSGCPSPTATSTPHAPGGLRMPSVIGSTWATTTGLAPTRPASTGKPAPAVGSAPFPWPVGPLVGGRVGNRQCGQLADCCLVLEHRLQPALGDLGLIGRVGRQKLGALGDHVDDRRHIVVVHPRPEEAELVLGARVAPRELAQ